jgi:hypothetical protein
MTVAPSDEEEDYHRDELLGRIWDIRIMALRKGDRIFLVRAPRI